MSGGECKSTVETVGEHRRQRGRRRWGWETARTGDVARAEKGRRVEGIGDSSVLWRAVNSIYMNSKRSESTIARRRTLLLGIERWPISITVINR